MQILHLSGAVLIPDDHDVSILEQPKFLQLLEYFIDQGFDGLQLLGVGTDLEHFAYVHGTSTRVHLRTGDPIGDDLTVYIVSGTRLILLGDPPVSISFAKSVFHQFRNQPLTPPCRSTFQYHGLRLGEPLEREVSTT